VSINKTEFEATDVDVEDWIGGVSFLQASHTIYRNPAMWADYQPVLNRIEVLERELDDLTVQHEDDVVEERPLAGGAALTYAVPTADRALGEKPVEDPHVSELRAELDSLKARANDMWEQYASDVEVWRLRKLEDEEAAAIKDVVGEPPAEPRAPSKNAKPQAITAYTKRFDTWYKAMQAYVVRYNLHAIAAATMSVTVAGVDKGKVTVEQMQRILARPGGKQHVTELVEVLEQLSMEGVDIVAPHRSGA
jgi:hypothetical protein